jgi:hypothetical protein
MNRPIADAIPKRDNTGTKGQLSALLRISGADVSGIGVFLSAASKMSFDLSVAAYGAQSQRKNLMICGIEQPK